MKILDVNNLIEVTLNDTIPGADEAVNALVDAADALAVLIARHYGIKHGRTSSEGEALGGLCASFEPAHPGQKCPETIDRGDPDGNWE